MESVKKKILLLLHLPAILFIWFIGWSLYWIGLRKRERSCDGEEDPSFIRDAGELSK